MTLLPKRSLFKLTEAWFLKKRVTLCLNKDNERYSELEVQSLTWDFSTYEKVRGHSVAEGEGNVAERSVKSFNFRGGQADNLQKTFKL